MAKDEIPKKSNVAPQKRKAAKLSLAVGDGAPPAKIPEIDLYAKVVSNEEKSARERNPDEDAKLYVKTCQDINRLLVEIAEKKINSTEESLPIITEMHAKVTAKIILLKKLNRLEKMRMKECRDALQQYREQVDNDHLHLQNLVYENLHLTKEVTKCYSFKSVDEDMELIPVEEFYAAAPKSVTKEEITKEDPHELKLARLSWELTQRKELSAKIKQMQLSKETITKDIEAKKEHLNNLMPHLKTILETTRPLQQLLNLQVDKTKKMNELALLLPDPMYILYVQADAFSKVVKWVNVSILGKPEEVRVHEHHYDNISSADSDSDSEGKTLRRRKQTQDRKKSSGKSGADVLQARQEECLKRHPLLLRITLTSPSGASVTLSFQWMLLLEVVCVYASVTGSGAESTGVAVADILASSSLLSAVFPGDTGSSCPNPSAAYHLQRAGLSTFPSDITGLGLPYRWAQTLCGLTFLPDEVKPSVAVCRQSLDSTLRAIHDRLRSRIALAKEVRLLESGEALHDKKLQALITSFSAASLSDFQRSASGAKLIEEGVIHSYNLFYRASINVHGVKIVVLVALPPAYPEVLPVFIIETGDKNSLTSLNNDHIRDVEREVNTSATESPSGLLLHQMYKLLLCTEVLAATELNPQQSVQATFFRNHIGRKRSHPYHYVPTAGGLFTHH